MMEMILKLKKVVLLVVGYIFLFCAPTFGVQMLVEAKWSFIICSAIGFLFYLAGVVTKEPSNNYEI